MIASNDLCWASRLVAGYVVTANIPYAADNAFARLDVYQPCENGVPFNPCRRSLKPTLMFIHGGGWLDDASKESYSLWFLPFLQLGWIVVNVEYRPSSAAPAPAALEDCLAALHWIGRNAQLYSIDTGQLVIGGPSAGGYLALMVGLIASGRSPLSATLQRASIPLREDLLRPAAVINWCGIVDLVELMAGSARQEFASKWLGEGADGLALAAELSPVRYVHAGGVPIVTVHGDQDSVVPHAQAVRFHAALTGAAVRNELVTLRGAGHAFDAAASVCAYRGFLGFLARA